MREIELKFLLPNTLSQPEADHILRSILPAVRREVQGRGTDYYFKVPGPADFARIRLLSDSPAAELTVKRSDGAEGGMSRIELSHPFACPRTAVPFMREILGPEVCVIRKTFTEYLFEDGTTVSTATVEGFDFVVLEVEARTASAVLLMSNHIRDQFLELGKVQLRPESRSIFTMFVEPLIAAGN